MNDQTKEKKRTAEEKLNYAKKLIKNDRTRDTDEALIVLTELSRQKRGISIKQSTEAAFLLAPILEKKKKEIKEAIAKLGIGVDYEGVKAPIEAIGFLMNNQIFLTKGQINEVVVLFDKFMKREN